MTEGPHPEQSVENDMQRIDALKKTLAWYADNNPSDPRVSTALEILHTTIFTLERKALLLSNHVIAIMTGSLQYKDPINLDVDIHFQGRQENQFAMVEPLLYTIEQELEQLPNWPVGRCDPNFGTSSLERLRDWLKRKQQGHTDEIEDILAGIVVSEVLTGEAFFPEQKGQLASLRRDVNTILRQSPALRQQVIEELQDVIRIRDERREQKGLPPRNSIRRQ